MFGYVKTGVGIPLAKVADCEFNRLQIQELILEAYKKNVKILTFPELSLTGYTCGDLFLQNSLILEAENQLGILLEETKNMDMVIAVGLPVICQNKCFNAAAILLRGKILGVVAKTYLPNYGEFYERRWFSSSSELNSKTAFVCSQEVPIGSDLIFKCGNRKSLIFGAEICEDLWAPIPPGTYLSMSGATILLNLSASNALAGKNEFRLDLVLQQSERCICGYVYASAGIGESTTDIVFDGHSIICEKGSLISESEKFIDKNRLITGEIDTDYILRERLRRKYSGDSNVILNTREINFEFESGIPKPDTVLPLSPFLPSNDDDRRRYFNDIFHIQSFGLIKRLRHINNAKAVIGISGGLDSTLALLVSAFAVDKLGVGRKNIIGVTMPGFGTTGRTYNNALRLMQELGIETMEISIKEACLQHFQSIGHDPDNHDLTYENTQARERTQVLMDIANKESGIVVGTGDMSELALGFATYNGDHMSMYGVNAGVPKTIIKNMISWISENNLFGNSVSSILNDVLDTPVSPELLPGDDKGGITQKTEEIVGPYEVHDYFIYYMLGRGFSPAKLYHMAIRTFNGKYTHEQILDWLRTFYKRFFSQQYKRSCMPDGPKVIGIGLSPRGDLKMPSDAMPTLWLKELDELN